MWAQNYVQETVDDVLRLLSTGQAKAPSNHVDNRLDVAMHKTQVTRSRSTSSTMHWKNFEGFHKLWYRATVAIVGSFANVKCYHSCCVNLRPDLLDLAHGFINQNSWGQMRALQRWAERQGWFKILPRPFPIPICIH